MPHGRRRGWLGVGAIMGALAVGGASIGAGAMQFPRMDDGPVKRAGGVFVTAGPQYEVDATDLPSGTRGTAYFGCPGQGKAKPALVTQVLDLAPGDAQVYVALQVRPFTGTGENADDWAVAPDNTTICARILERAASAGLDPATQTVMGIARAGVGLMQWDLMPALPMAPNDTFFGLATDATGAPWVKTGPSARDVAGAPFTRWDEDSGAWVPGAEAPPIVQSTAWPAPRNHQLVWLDGNTKLDITSATSGDMVTVRAIERTAPDGTVTSTAPRVDYRTRVNGEAFGQPPCRVPRTMRVRQLAGVTGASSDGAVVLGDGPWVARVRCLDRPRTVTASVVRKPLRSTDGGLTWRPWGIPAAITNPLWIDAGVNYGTGPWTGCDTGYLIRRWQGARVRNIICALPFLAN